MVADGDVVRIDDKYSLSTRQHVRQQLQDSGEHPTRGTWNGQWHLMIFAQPVNNSSDSFVLRKTMKRLRFGSLREGVWKRPDNIEIIFPNEVQQRAVHYSARPTENARQVADKLFDLDGWSQRAHQIVADSNITGTVEDLYQRAAVMSRHLRSDPLLPHELLPGDWPGDELRVTYERSRQQFLHHVHAILDQSAAREDEQVVPEK